MYLNMRKMAHEEMHNSPRVLLREVKNLIIQGTTLVFNGQREGKDIQKYSVFLKNSVSVVARGCRRQPQSDNEGALQLTQHHHVEGRVAGAWGTHSQGSLSPSGLTAWPGHLSSLPYSAVLEAVCLQEEESSLRRNFLCMVLRKCCSHQGF